MINVAVGIVRDQAGRVLVNQRMPGGPHPGRWEFPGGKIEYGESPYQALVRELAEEVGIEVLAARPQIRLSHRYPDKEVCLHVWQLISWRGQPRPCEGHRLRYVSLSELRQIDLLEADAPIVSSLELPEIYAISGVPGGDDRGSRARWLKNAVLTLDRQSPLLQVRLPGVVPATLRELARDLAALPDLAGARILLNGDPDIVIPLAIDMRLHGVHLPARYLAKFTNRHRDSGLMIAASCHDRNEIDQAQEAGVDFAVLGPVKPTRSHPHRKAMGWQDFAQLVATATMPVFAIGGLDRSDLETAWEHGAQGVAGISAFWHGD